MSQAIKAVSTTLNELLLHWRDANDFFLCKINLFLCKIMSWRSFLLSDWSLNGLLNEVLRGIKSVMHTKEAFVGFLNLLSVTSSKQALKTMRAWEDHTSYPLLLMWCNTWFFCGHAVNHIWRTSTLSVLVLCKSDEICMEIQEENRHKEEIGGWTEGLKVKLEEKNWKRYWSRDPKFNIMKFKTVYYTRTGYPSSYMLKMVRLWRYPPMGFKCPRYSWPHMWPIYDLYSQLFDSQETN